MKLAEALAQRSDIQARLNRLQERILRNLKVQEGESPLEDPQALLEEVRALHAQQVVLVQQINARNVQTRLPDGQLLSDALALRESLLKRRSNLSSILTAATEPNMRMTRSEIKTYVTIPIAALQKEVDELSRQYRELDTVIQSINWTVDL